MIAVAIGGDNTVFTADIDVIVGDTPHDVRCARAIGANAVAVLTGWHGRAELAACNPDLLLDDLSDPERLLRHWCAPA